MKDLLKPIRDQIAKLWAAVDRKPTFRWGTVSQETPLLVQLDGDIDPAGDPVDVAPQSVVSSIPVGARVACIEQDRRVIVIAVAS
ncbi:hypothetical protein ACTJJ4_11530 [Microbacterium sp. 22195]|uniref:hypothetical protein n=1 Tax=Microbacterium sp. 22195 TaxID=3453891 RepID=UPI003F825F1A